MAVTSRATPASAARMSGGRGTPGPPGWECPGVPPVRVSGKRHDGHREDGAKNRPNGRMMAAAIAAAADISTNSSMRRRSLDEPDEHDYRDCVHGAGHGEEPTVLRRIGILRLEQHPGRRDPGTTATRKNSPADVASSQNHDQPDTASISGWPRGESIRGSGAHAGLLFSIGRLRRRRATLKGHGRPILDDVTVEDSVKGNSHGETWLGQCRGFDVGTQLHEERVDSVRLSGR